MKLLFETIDRVELDEAKMSLESKGIPVFIGNEDSARNFGLYYPARRYALWVALDDQYNDALSTLNNKDHEVTISVDVQEYYRQLEDFRQKNTKHIFNNLILIFILVMMVMFMLYSYYNAQLT